MGRLTALRVKNAPPGRHADGLGLYLLVSPSQSRSWMLRVQVDGVRRDIGLGSVELNPDARKNDEIGEVSLLNRKRLTLSEARNKARMLRDAARAGLDPVLERDKDRQAIPTFKKAAEACKEDMQAGWAPKNAAAFLSSLNDHAFGHIGRLRVDHIEASHIRDLLAPIWMTKPEQARKVRQRVGMVLNYAKAKGWRSTETPGRSVTMGLGRQGQGGNFAAMPYADVPDFVAVLNTKTETVGRLALLFTIHTAARSGEVRQARWLQIDREKKMWNRPATIMKGGLAHSVTLTDGALAVLDRAAKLRTDEKDDALIFPSASNTPLSDNTLSKIMRDAKLPYTVHGFRSSFRDFAAEQMPSIPDAVAEAALAHVVPDKVERAYKRTKFIEMRRKLMDGWAGFLSGNANVLRLEMAR